MKPDDPPARLAIGLDLLAATTEQWLTAQAELPGRLDRLASCARERGAQGDRERANRFLRVCAALGGSAAPGGVGAGAGAAEFARAVGELEAAERAAPDWDQPGSAYAMVHLLRNLTIHLDPERIAGAARWCRAELDGPAGGLAPEVRAAVETVERVTGKDPRALGDAVRAVRAAAARVWEAVGPVTRTGAEIEGAGSWVVVSAEDVPEWRASVRRVIEIANRQLRGAVELEHRECDNATAAREQLDGALRGARQGGPRPLLLLDLGIPAGPAGPAGFNVGRALLEDARSRLRVPVIVLTTPHNFLGDHLLAHRFGVADYLLKGVESERALLTALVRLVTARRTRTLALARDGSRVVRIDDIELRLDPVPFAVLAAAASRRWSGPCRPITVTDLRSEVRDRFGVECPDIEDAVYKLRRALTDGCRSAGRTIDPAEEIICSDQCGADFAYRVTARVTDGGEAAPRPRAPCHVLVVEDDVSGWGRPVAELLGRYGYVVAAVGSAAEAVERLRDFCPDIACVDLCLPDRPGDRPAPAVGLALLRHLGERSPDTVPVVLTALADDDRLRDEIVRLGPRPDEILSKSGGLPGVAAALVLRLWRAELQIERRATLPLPELARLPYLRLRVRSRPDGAEEFVQMEVFGRVWHPTVRERQLLVLLARRPGRSVLQREIFDVLWPADDLALDDVDVSNALKVLVRRLRHRIMVEWLGLPDSAPARRAARQVLSNDGKDSYMLNARVDWEPVG